VEQSAEKSDSVSGPVGKCGDRYVPIQSIRFAVDPSRWICFPVMHLPDTHEREVNEFVIYLVAFFVFTVITLTYETAPSTTRETERQVESLIALSKFLNPTQKMAPGAIQRSDRNEPTRSAYVPLHDLFSLQGKKAICTGATGGIGKELCTTLAEAGCDIISIQLSHDPAGPCLAKAVTDLGRKFVAFEANVGDSEAIRKCFDDIWQAGHEADILLNAAGTNKRGPVCDLTDKEIDAVTCDRSPFSLHPL
jgi:FlaA1/EpsC-like NDP-sugar epimerase